MVIPLIFLETYCLKESYSLKFKQCNFTKAMSRVDVFVLAVLSQTNKQLSLSSIVRKIGDINLAKPPSRIGIYKRLHVLQNKQLVNSEWKEGEKTYAISHKGMAAITEFINQLNGVRSA
jgi:DNA-binding PadR family transcriptional regulator